MKKVHFYLLLLCCCLAACKKEETPAPIPSDINIAAATGKDILEFKFTAKDNPEQLLRDVTCYIDSGHITGWIPYISSNKTLVATFRINGVSVSMNGTWQQSGATKNDYSRQLIFTVKAADSSTRAYDVTLHTFTGLPVLYLSTTGPVVSKEDDIPGSLHIDANARYDQPVTDLPLEIRGRGNSTWEMPKKPYRIKFDKKTAMLGMPAAKKWVLLANYGDKTLIRNYLALEISRRFGAVFTPRARYVEVVMNGEYLGNYLLTDQVEIGETRVNITELKPTATDISGGYLMEVDERLDEEYWFRTTLQAPFTIKSPEDITPAQLTYIHNYIQQVENTLYSPGFNDPVTGYTQYINDDTFINWFLVNELLKNNDAIFFSSVFLYKDRNAKLCMGPVWDFDLAAGNINANGNNDPTGWWVQQSIWIHRLFDDPAFVQKVKNRWNALKTTQVNTLFQFINETADELQSSQQQNFEKWNVLPYTWPGPVAMGTYDNEVQYLKEWLSKRINWMDNALNNL